MRLAAAMDLPLRDRNNLLVAAGLPPAYRESPLDDVDLRPIRAVLERMLAAHEPYPAWVVDGHWQFRMTNTAGERLFPGLVGAPPSDVVDRMFGPGPMRAQIENWAEVCWAGLSTLRREASRNPSPELVAMVERAEAHLAGVEPPPLAADPELPVVCPVFRVGGRRVRTIGAVVRFDTAIDVTAAELKLELMFPADRESAEVFEALAGASGRLG